VWLSFFQAMGWPLTLTILSVIVLENGADTLFSWWMSVWADDTQGRRSQTFYMVVFVLLSVLSLMFVFFRLFLYVRGSRSLSMSIHLSALNGVFRSPMSYFDSTKSGRIINRFSADLSMVDNDLVPEIMWFCCSVVWGLSCLVVVLLSAPFVLALFVPLLYLYYQLQEHYRANAREIHRLCSTSRSPVFDSYNEALQGMATIRAMQQQARFCTGNERRLLFNLSAYFLDMVISLWLNVRIQLFTVVIFGTVLALGIVQHENGWNFGFLGKGAISAGVIGLALNKSLELASVFGGLINCFTAAETSLIAMERLLTFTNLTPERPLELPTDKALDYVLPAHDAKAAKAWPWRGEVEFRNVKMSYRPDLPLVLKGISFKLPAGTSLGVVGRTGAGKSSLLAMLFRLVELEVPAEVAVPIAEQKEAPKESKNSGHIFIDGIDIASVGLQTLRNRLAIIPQSPVLFSGTIRSNLDPLNEIDDNRLWHVLQEVELEQFVRSKENGLKAEVKGGGENLSVGQRQLLCLARALLRESKVVVLDEATANVDPVTDGLIQQSLSKQIRATGSTIITIAHRIGTIVHNDMILVMEDGHAVEFGPTKSLLRDPNSRFFELAKASGLVALQEKTKPSV
jgi:ABC-type multidrug transport system fused ATPase/permease subunit